MSLFIRYLLIGIMLPFGLSSAPAQSMDLPQLQGNGSLEHLISEVWTTRHGLPHNSVNAMAQDSQGYLWLGTWQGPSRFNGREFEIYDDIRVTGLPDIGIFTVDVNHCNGSLYVGGARGGISRHDDGQWQELQPAPPFINNLNVDSQCNLWVSSSEQGLLFYENDQRSSVFTTDNGLPSNAVFQSLLDKQGNLWAATSEGLAVKAANATGFSLIKSVPDGRVRTLVMTPTGQILVGTQEGIYQQTEKFGFKRFQPDFNASISALHYSPEGHLWIGTYRRGVWRIRNGEMQSLDTDSGLPNNHVLDIMHDHEGSIWVSTHGGLVQFRDALFAKFTKSHGLVGNYVRAVMEYQGNIYVGTSNGVTRINSEGNFIVGEGTELEGQSVLSFQRHNDELIIGTYTGGAFAWNGKQVTRHYHQGDKLPDNEVRKIASSSRYGLVLGGPDGLTHISPYGIKQLTVDDGLLNNYTTALFFDSEHQLWAGSVSGVVKITLTDAGDDIRYQTEEINLRSLSGAELAFQIVEKLGHLWIATDRGLVVHRMGTDEWQIFNRDNGLPFDNFLSVAFDGDANLWLGSNRGAIFIDHDAFTKTLNDPDTLLPYQRYTEVDGMSSSQVNSGGPSLYRSSNGHLWLATASGVSVINPQHRRDLSSSPPPVVIESVKADDRTLSYGEEVASDTQRVAFEYAGLGYLMSDHIRYQVRMRGFDNDWIDKDSLTRTEYTALPARDYVFQVRASYPGGAWSEPAQFAFSRSEHFWQKPTTWALLLLAAVLIAFIVVRARLRFLNRSRRQLDRMVQEKTAELETLVRQDPLTGLGNRRAFDERLRLELKRSQRSDKHLSLAIIDVDFFKQVNDRFLHTVGDQVLIELSRLLVTLLRDVDYAARWGGEEFAVLLPDTSLEEAIEVADRVRNGVQHHDFSRLLDEHQLTVSIGVSCSEHYPDHSSLLVAADQALYQAKSNGRNRLEYK